MGCGVTLEIVLYLDFCDQLTLLFESCQLYYSCFQFSAVAINAKSLFSKLKNEENR